MKRICTVISHVTADQKAAFSDLAHTRRLPISVLIRELITRELTQATKRKTKAAA
jgi:hypothetical protein